MARLLLVVGHLQRQRAARRQTRAKPGDDLHVAGNPVKQRIGEDEVEAVGVESRGVAFEEPRARNAFGGGGQHVGAQVYADNIGFWVGLAQSQGR